MLFKIFHKLKMVVIVTTIFFIGNNLHAAAALKGQSGIWVVRHNLHSKQAIDKTIAAIVEMDIETVYLQVRGRGYALYNSTIAPKSPKIREEFDPLTYFINRAKPYNLKIHAWINTYLLWTAPDDPVSEKHLYHTHPEWFEVAIKNSPFYKTRNVYLSPHLTEVNEHITSLIQELVQNYDLHGIHLDYVRYLDKYHGYHEKAINRFHSIYTLPKGDLFKLVENEFWIDFKSMQVTSLVESIQGTIKADNPDMVLSTAVKPDPALAKSDFGQNWRYWLEKDLVDYVIIMNYTADHYDFIQNLNIINRECDSKKVYCGVALYNKNMTAIRNQIQSAKKLGFDKIVLFSYDSILENKWLKTGG